jgi:hypothetical protein
MSLVKYVVHHINLKIFNIILTLMANMGMVHKLHKSSYKALQWVQYSIGKLTKISYTGKRPMVVLISPSLP